MENKVLDEINEAVRKIDEEDYKLLASLIRKAKRVFVSGVGRSGLIGRCFAIRLRHLGIESYVAGESICPPIKKGDLLVVVSSSGKKKTVISITEEAKKVKAGVVVVTSEKDTPLTELADYIIHLPVKDSSQFGSSLFEQVSLIFFDTFVEEFRKKYHISHRDMAERHTNLE